MLSLSIPGVKVYPEITAARIILNGNQYATPNFTATQWKQSAAFKTVDGKQGQIEVVYLEARPDEVEGPFLAEERDLINAIADSLVSYHGREQAKQALRASEETFRAISTSAQDAIIMMADKRISFWNAAAERMFGYTAAEALGQELHTLLVQPQLQAAFAHGYTHFQASGEGPVIGKVLEQTARRKGGEEFPVELTISATQFDGQWHAIGIVRDITARKRTETDLQHANRALATLSAVNRTLVQATNEDELLRAICQAIIQQRDYRLAWVGYVQHDKNKTIKIMARAGQDEDYLDAIQLTWAESEYGMGPSGYAIRSSTTQVCQDMANDPQSSPWRDAALQRGYTSDIALPLTKRNGEVFGILHVYAAEVNAFTPAEVDLLEEMAGDLAFGVRSLHIRQERDLALVKNQAQLVQPERVNEFGTLAVGI